MKLQLLAVALAATAATTLTLPAHAVLVNNAAALGATSLVDFEAYDGLLTSGPVAVAADVAFTGDDGSELGAYIRDLNDNGAWGVGNHFAASGFVGELRFTFNGLSSGAGAFVNHFALDVLPFSMVVSAYGDNNQIIETHTMMVDTAFDSYNEGVFLGIQRASADIRSISFKGVGVVVHNFAYSSPVPETGTWALMLAGLAGVGFLRTRQAAR